MMATSTHPEQAFRPSADARHAYGTSSAWSLGVEEEFQLVHPETGDLVSRVDAILGRAGEHELGNIKAELMQSVVEVATPVCTNAAEAAEELRALRRRVSQLADDAGCQIASAGTHPFSRYEFQDVTDRERYREIVSRLRWVAQRELIFGLHVHVGVESPEKAIYVFNHIRRYLPELLALSANSPFWQGRETGLRSSRSNIFDSFPRSGMPDAFDSYAQWDALMQRAMGLGAMEDYTFVWWDVRPHPKFGTIEVRVCDGQTRLRDSLALAALIQAIAAWLGEQFELGVKRDLPPKLLIEENKWRAARYGLDGEFLDLDNERGIPAREAVSRLVETVAPYARDLGSAEQFAALDSLVVRNGADRQLACYAETGSLMSVAKMLVRETAEA
jgi:glutamate---cysteine ligase / carboxylate-amine ligase